MEIPTRNYASYVSSIGYSRMPVSRFPEGRTTGSSSTQVIHDTSDGSDATRNDYTQGGVSHSEEGAIPGLETSGISKTNTFLGVTTESGRTSTLSRIGNGFSGNTEVNNSGSKDAGWSTTTYSQTDHTFGSETTGNPTFTASNQGAVFHTFTTFGVLTASSSQIASTQRDSNLFKRDNSYESRASFRGMAGGRTQSGNGGSTHENNGTTTSSRNNLAGTINEVVYAAYTVSSLSKTDFEYEADSDGITVKSTAAYTRISTGGNTTAGTTSFNNIYASGLSEVYYDSNDSPHTFTTTYLDTEAGSTTASGEPNQTSFTSSTSGSSVSALQNSLSYFRTTDSRVIYDQEGFPGGLTEGSTSTEVSKVYNLPSSLSNTDTMRSYIVTITDASQTYETYTYTTVEETNDSVTSPYDFQLIRVSSNVYEGGWGVYGITDTSLAGSLDFSTFKTDQVSTLVEINTGDKEISRIPLQMSPVGSETSSGEFVFVRPTTTTLEGKSYVGFSSTETTIITINSNSPTATYYNNYNFKGKAATSSDTVVGISTLYFDTTSSDTKNRSDTTESQSTITTYNRATSYTFTSNNQKGAVATLQTYFDLDKVKSFVDASRFIAESIYTETSFTGIGFADFGVSKTLIRNISQRNTIIEAAPRPNLATYSSRVVGIVYISDSTTKIDQRDNLRPPNIQYTTPFLSTTTQSFPAASDDATVVSVTTMTDESYAIPNAQIFSINGFRYLIRDETLTVYDALNNSITYDGTGSRIESRATFTGTLEVTSTLPTGDTTNTTDTVTGYRNFDKIFKNIDGAGGIADVLTVHDTTAYGGATGLRLYFGGCRHYDSQGTIVYAHSHKMTLVDRNDSAKTTEIAGNLNNFYGSSSTELDKHTPLFISTRTEMIVGSQNFPGSAILTKTYARSRPGFY